MNIKVEKSGSSDKYFSVMVPLIENLGKANRVITRVAYFLDITDKRVVDLTASEVKEDGEYFTKFSIHFSDPQPGAEKAIEFALNQALKEGEDEK